MNCVLVIYINNGCFYVIIWKKLFQFYYNNKILENKKMAMNISNISNISSNDNLEIGGSVFFLIYISEYLPYVTLVSIGSVIGVIGIDY